MRQFNYEAPKAPSVLRQRLEFWWYAVMPILFIGIIGVCGLWAGYRYYQSSNEDTTSHRSSREILDPTELEATFLDRYTNAKYLTEMDLSRKMHVVGTYSNDNGLQVFTGTFDFKGNGNFRLDVTQPLELEFIEGTLASKVSPLFESQADLIRAFVDAMQDPLLALKDTHLDEPLKLEPTQFMGIDAYETHLVLSRQHINTTLTISAKSLTFLERYNHSPTDPAQRYRYSDYRAVAGIRLPHSISIKDQWGVISRISLTNIDLESEKSSIAGL
jgi:hypothetical protein